MKKMTIICVIVLACISFSGNFSASFSNDKIALSKNEKDEIDKLKDDINSNSREIRSNAAKKIISLYYLKKIKLNEAVPGLIKELESINWESLTETEGEYSGELIYILGEYGDRRAIPSILNSLGHSGGTLVTDALAKIGPDALDSLINKMDDGRNNVRRDALFYLGKTPTQIKQYGHKLSEVDKNKIKNALKKGFNDNDESVRRQAIDSIGDVQVNYSKDELKDVESSIESISKNDPYRTIRKVNGKAVEIYPVRDEASKVLNMLKKTH